MVTSFLIIYLNIKIIFINIKTQIIMPESIPVKRKINEGELRIVCESGSIDKRYSSIDECLKTFKTVDSLVNSLLEDLQSNATKNKLLDYYNDPLIINSDNVNLLYKISINNMNEFKFMQLKEIKSLLNNNKKPKLKNSNNRKSSDESSTDLSKNEDAFDNYNLIEILRITQVNILFGNETKLQNSLISKNASWSYVINPNIFKMVGEWDGSQPKTPKLCTDGRSKFINFALYGSSEQSYRETLLEQLNKIKISENELYEYKGMNDEKVVLTPSYITTLRNNEFTSIEWSEIESDDFKKSYDQFNIENVGHLVGQNKKTSNTLTLSINVLFEPIDENKQKIDDLKLKRKICNLYLNKKNELKLKAGMSLESIEKTDQLNEENEGIIESYVLTELDSDEVYESVDQFKKLILRLDAKFAYEIKTNNLIIKMKNEIVNKKQLYEITCCYYQIPKTKQQLNFGNSPKLSAIKMRALNVYLCSM
jgi:hypothetical protein